MVAPLVIKTPSTTFDAMSMFSSLKDIRKFSSAKGYPMSKEHPDLVDRLFSINLQENSTDDLLGAQMRKIVLQYTREQWDLHGEEYRKRANDLNEMWQPIHENVMSVLEDILQVKWPSNEDISGYVTINPTSPRYLDSREFCVSVQKDLLKSKITIAHELIHFFYFKKLKELFPELDEVTFEKPHLEWQLSEIAVYPILNDIRLSQVLSLDKRVMPKKPYDSYSKTNIGEVSILEHFSQGYARIVSPKNPASFSEFLDWSRNEGKKYEEIIRECIS